MGRGGGGKVGGVSFVSCGRFPTIPHRVVALQVAFERQTLKPGFHLIGYRL
jgi:hypothetical protein